MISTLLFSWLLALLSLGTPGGALERGLASVSVTSIEADLGFLADEVMSGRETPSPELELAAEYLLNRVKRAGLSPGANGSWFQEYQLERTALSDESRLYLELAGVRVQLSPVDGYLWVSSSRRAASIVGEAVAVGDGDRQALDALPADALRGRWAVASTTPRMLQSTRRRLTQRGALGLLVIPFSEPGAGPDPAPERLVKRTRARLEFGRFGLASASRSQAEHNGRRKAIPILQLAPQVHAQLLQLVPELDLEPGSALELRVHEERLVTSETRRVRNLCALLPGLSGARAQEVIVCSAHYDHLGVRDGVVYPGADDNASGTVGLLALAESLRAHGPVDRSVLFVWFSGEEQGLWGSEAFCKSPPLADGFSIVANLNLDMIGRTSPDELYITPSRDHGAFGPCAELAYSLSPTEGFPELRSQDEFYSASDHYNFASLLDVPVVFLSSGDHPDYHEPGDTADKIDALKLSRVARLGLRIVIGMSALELDDEARR